MKERIEAEMEKLQKLTNNINQGKQQMAQMEQTALIMQGRINMLQELEQEEKVEE